MNAIIGDKRKHNLTAYVRQETDVKANKDEADDSLMDVEEPRSTTVTNTSEAEVVGKSSLSESADGVVESMQCESFASEISVHDHSSLSESVEHMEASVNTIQVKADPIEDTDSGTHSDLYPSSYRSERENIQSNCNLQGMQPLSRASHMVSSVDDKVKHTTRLSEDERNNQHEMAQVEEFVAVGNESSERVIEEETIANANTNFASEDGHQTTKLTGGDYVGEHGKAAIELSDKVWSDEYCAMSMIINLEPECKFSDSNYLASIPDTAISDIETTNSSNMMPTHPNSKNFLGNDSQEVRIEPEVNTEIEVVAECVGGGIVGSKQSHNGDVEVPEENLENPIIKEQGLSPINSEISLLSKPTPECDDKLTKQPSGASAVDISVDSSSQTDSVEGNLGLISEHATLRSKIASEREHFDKVDVFEPPSFMTLVEPKCGGTGSEIEIVQSTQQPNSEALQAAWFPSLTNVVNQSPGRKKNKEIIAKVTNWSTGKQDGTPLKNLLGEAKVETRSKSMSPKQTENDETAGKINGTSVTTMKEVLGSEVPGDQAVKKETVEEWNSPARYPVEIQKERRKVKGKSSWVPFVCCSSVN